MEFDPRAVLGQQSSVQCLACGTKNEVGATSCSRCNTTLTAEDEDDIETLNVFNTAAGNVAAPELTGPNGQPHKANIDKLQEALEGLKNGTLNVEAYQMQVGDVYRLMNGASQLAHTDVAKKKIEEVDPEFQPLLRQLSDYIDDYLKGVTRMRDYGTSQNMEDAEEGYKIALKAADGMLEIQQKCDAIVIREEPEAAIEREQIKAEQAARAAANPE
jgi:hypothetical protein